VLPEVKEKNGNNLEIKIMNEKMYKNHRQYLSAMDEKKVSRNLFSKYNEIPGLKPIKEKNVNSMIKMTSFFLKNLNLESAIDQIIDERKNIEDCSGNFPLRNKNSMNTIIKEEVNAEELDVIPNEIDYNQISNQDENLTLTKDCGPIESPVKQHFKLKFLNSSKILHSRNNTNVGNIKEDFTLTPREDNVELSKLYFLF
jgi:hypothetical protein